jgi:hypothetical protein
MARGGRVAVRYHFLFFFFLAEGKHVIWMTTV